MSGPLLYNPTRAELGELDAMLVARRPQVEKLVADIAADAGRATTRHWQIVGPRGSGKSHITQLIALRLEAKGWAVARLSEEQYRVNSVGDLLEQIVIRLENSDESPLADVEAKDLEDKAIDRIRAWRKKAGKPILVVVENLGMLLERKLRDRRDQARLRELLGRDAPFTLLATATSFVDATTKHDEPFYHFFQPITLDDLSVDEVTDLILARATWDDEKVLLAQTDRLRGRVRAMYHFSGGNPRLVMALYGVLRAGVTDELYQELLELLDAVTPYYQARLHDVAPQAERVLAEMALAGKRLTPSVIAKRCRMPTNQITALISKLEAERFIAPTGRPDGRSRYYDLTDRLFRIWMQMREDRGARSRLRFLSDFYQRWYAGHPDEVDDAMKKTSAFLWTDVHEAATRRIRERLRTLDYLGSAVPDRGVLMALRNLDLTRSPFEIKHDDPQLASVVLLSVTEGQSRWLQELVSAAASSWPVRQYLAIRALAVLVRVMSEMRKHDNGAVEPEDEAVRKRVADWFRNDASALLKEQPNRAGEVLTFYKDVRASHVLACDLLPFSVAVAVRDDPDLMKELSPEVREAVELLLGAASAAKAERDTSEAPRQAYRVETRGTASIAAEGKKPRRAPSAAGRGRGKLRT